MTASLKWYITLHFNLFPVYCHDCYFFVYILSGHHCLNNYFAIMLFNLSTLRMSLAIHAFKTKKQVLLHAFRPLDVYLFYCHDYLYNAEIRQISAVFISFTAII